MPILGLQCRKLYLRPPPASLGAAYYSLSAVLCFGGFTATKKKAALAIIYGGAAAHALLLFLAWRGTGELCPVCLKFLLVEVLLAVYVTIYPPRRVFLVPAVLAGAGLIMVAGLLAFNPRVVPAAAAPAVPPEKVISSVPAEKEETASLPKQDFVEKRYQQAQKAFHPALKLIQISIPALWSQQWITGR